MRIALLSNAAVVHTRRWVESLRARGHVVGLWSLEPEAAPLGTMRLPAAPLPGFLRYPLAAPAARAAIERFAPDVVNAHYVPNYGVIGALAGRHPLVVSAWGSDLLVAGARDPLQRLRARAVLRRADAVVGDSSNLAAAAIALGAPRERVHAIPWGVDRGLYRPGPAREPGLIVSTRMHEEIYDLPVVIDALARLMARHPEAQVVFAGAGSQTGALYARASARLPRGRWRFSGRLEPAAMATLLARAEIAVSASRSDSTSLSLLESMSCGAIPVVTDIEGNREWVAEGDGARLFAPGDAAGLATALERALTDPLWASAARERNQRIVAARGDWAVNLTRIEALYASLAAEHGGSGT